MQETANQPKSPVKRKSSTRLRKMVMVGMLAAIATVLMYLEIPMAFLFPAAPFLKLDFSSLPVIIGSFMFGPLSGIVISFFKAVIHLMSTSTFGIGELTDFIISSTFALTCGLAYKSNKTRKGALWALVFGTLASVVVGVFANWFVALPLYSHFMNFKIGNIALFLVAGIAPFNLLKGVVVSVVTFFVYKRLSGPMRQFTE